MTNQYLKYYEGKEYQELIAILEHPSGYIPEVLELCKEILEQKNVSDEQKVEIAKKHHIKRFILYFNKGKHWRDVSVCLDSHFLSEAEMRYCFEEAKQQYTDYINLATYGVSG